MSLAGRAAQRVTRRRIVDPKDRLRAAGVGAVSATYRRSDVIYSQGDVADSVFYLQEGSVKLSVSSRGGKQGVVAILKSGEFFGDSALAGRPLRLERATAVADTTLLIIPKAKMIRLLHADHALSDRFIAHLLKRNSRMEGDLVDHLLNSSEKRLARALLLLAHYGQPGKPRHVPAKISQTTLAEMVGTTRSRVNFFMNKFKSLGFIKDDRGLKINPALFATILADETLEAPERKAG